jgi:glycosyltransferase involved in cell wall biosynthesis
LRILYFTSVDATDDTAPSVRVRESCKALSELGNRVALIHVANSLGHRLNVSWLDKELPIKWPAFRGGWKIFQLVATIALIRAVRNWKPDLVYLRCSNGNIIDFAFMRINKPLVLELNGLEFLDDPKFERRARLCDRLLVDDPIMARHCLEALPSLAHKIGEHSIFAINPALFAPQGKEECCRKLSVSPDPFRMIHVSGFYPWHDFDTILAALERVVARTSQNLELLLIGDGPRRSSIAAAVKSRGLESFVKLPGKIPHKLIATHIGSSDLAIDLFSARRLDEGKNLAAMKLYEYAACCRPVITAVSSDFVPPEWAGKSFGLIPPEDPESLAGSILSVIQEPEKWRLRAHLAAEYVREHKNWHAAARNTLVHLEEILKETQV